MKWKVGLSLSLYLLSSMPYFCTGIGSAVTYAAAYTKYMDKMGEATFDLGKRHDAAAGDGKLHQPKRGVNGGRVVRTAGRKDRHSKVCTARGTRDRRVRLSPNTAVLFYDLQDRLGCDRPSKAIDWLMTEAKAAIDALGDPPAAAAANCNRSATTSVGCNELFSGRVPPPPLMSGREGGGDYQGEILSASPTPLELFDTNSEIVRLQRIFSWNHGAAGEDYSSAALYYSAAADFHAFAEREPLQSSYSRINCNYPQFQGLGFSDLPSSINYEE